MSRNSFQTLTEPMTYVLLALLEECNGVDIMERVRVLSHGRVAIGPGTLYTMLSKFEDNGIVCRTRQEGRQKWYLITDEGKAMLRREYERLQAMTKDVEAALTPRS